jgi:hypothetical protein
MKQDQDGLYTDFCCAALEYHTKHPLRCVTFDPDFKKFDNEEGEHRACIFLEKPSGVAQKGAKSEPAGKAMIPINFCMFCGAPIKFE